MNQCRAARICRCWLATQAAGNSGDVPGDAARHGPPPAIAAGSAAQMAPVPGSGVQMPAGSAPQMTPGSEGCVTPGTGTGIAASANTAPSFSPGECARVEDPGRVLKRPTQ